MWTDLCGSALTRGGVWEPPSISDEGIRCPHPTHYFKVACHRTPGPWGRGHESERGGWVSDPHPRTRRPACRRLRVIGGAGTTRGTHPVSRSPLPRAGALRFSLQLQRVQGREEVRASRQTRAGGVDLGGRPPRRRR